MSDTEGAATGVPGLRDPDLFRQANLVGGRWIQAASGAMIAVADPATGALVGRVPASTSAVVVRSSSDRAAAA